MSRPVIIAAMLLVSVIAGAIVFSVRPSVVDHQVHNAAQPQPDAGETRAEPLGHQKLLRPTYTPPVVHNPALASFVNRESREERVTGDIPIRLPRVDHPDDIKAVADVLLDTKDDDTVRHEAANLLRRSGYSGLTSDLFTVLHNLEEKERFRSFVVQHLWLQVEGAQGDERQKVVSELHACLADRHVAVRRESLLALVRLNDPAGTETALNWFAEEKPENNGVLDLCIRVMRERDMREQLPAIRRLIASSNEDAARQAMVTVAQWGDQESRPLLENAAKSTRPLVKRAADAALKKLDQAKAAPVPNTEKGAGREPERGAQEKPRF